MVVVVLMVVGVGRGKGEGDSGIPRGYPTYVVQVCDE